MDYVKLSVVTVLCAVITTVKVYRVQSLNYILPKKAIEAVQRWIDEHLSKTYLSEFLKTYPNAKLRDDGTPEGVCPYNPEGVCPYNLELKDIDDCDKYQTCVECWNQPIEGGEK